MSLSDLKPGEKVWIFIGNIDLKEIEIIALAKGKSATEAFENAKAEGVQFEQSTHQVGAVQFIPTDNNLIRAHFISICIERGIPPSQHDEIVTDFIEDLADQLKEIMSHK